MKKQLLTRKNYQERMNRVLVYIQDHFDEEISLDELAAASHFSRFHFHRIFSACCGESIQSYIRRLRLEHAAKKLVYTSDSITTISLDAGFETPSSFAKAFKKLTGMTPSAARQKGSLSDYANPYFNFKKTREEITVKPTIKTIEEQKIIFIRRKGSYFDSAPAAWKALTEYALQKNLPQQDVRLLGIAHDDPAVTSEENWRYDACVAGLAEPKADGEVGVQTIAGGKYAVFEHIGAYDTLGDTFRKIFGEWYPVSNIQLREIPCFVHYVGRNFIKNYGAMSHQERAQCVSHIYVPIE